MFAGSIDCSGASILASARRPKGRSASIGAGAGPTLAPAASGSMSAVVVGATAARGSYVAVGPLRWLVFTWGIPEDGTVPLGTGTVEVV